MPALSIAENSKRKERLHEQNGMEVSLLRGLCSLHQAPMPGGLRGGKEEDGDSVRRPLRDQSLSPYREGDFSMQKVLDVLVLFAHILV